MKLAWRHVSATGPVSTSRGGWRPTRTTQDPERLPLETAEVVSATLEATSGASGTATATVTHPAVLSTGSAASLTASAVVTHYATLSASSAASLSAAATVTHYATLSAGSAASLTAAATVTHYATLSASSGASITASAGVVVPITTVYAVMDLSASASIGASATVTHYATLATASAASISASATITQGPFQGMGLAEWHATIRSILYYQFAVPLGAYISFENVEPSQPDGALWMSADILDGPVELVELGSPKRLRVSGRVRVSIYAPLGTGVRDSMRMVDSLASALRAASDFGVRFGVPSARTVGRSGRHWLVNVDVPYRVDEIA